MKQAASFSVLLGAMFIMAVMLYLFWDHPARELLISGGAICLIALSLGLEKLWPHDRRWANIPHAEVAGDVGSFIIVFGVIDGALKWMTPFLLLALLSTSGGLDVPLWLQVILTLLGIEFAAWASHWAHHHVKPLWALHAMHHSPNHLYFYSLSPQFFPKLPFLSNLMMTNFSFSPSLLL